VDGIEDTHQVLVEAVVRGVLVHPELCSMMSFSLATLSASKYGDETNR